MTLIASPRISNRLHLRNRLPRPPFTVNKDSPQAQGLAAWFPSPTAFAPGGVVRDFSTRGGYMSTGGTPRVRAQPEAVGGQAWEMRDNNADRIDFGDILKLDGAMSFFCRAVFDTTTNNGALAVYLVSGSAGSYQIRQVNAQIWVISDFNAGPWLQSPDAITAGVPASVGYARNGGNFDGTIYYDGDAIKTGDSGNPSSSAGTCHLGNNGSTGVQPHDGTMWDIRFYNCEVPAALAFEIHDNPNDLFFELGRRTFFFPSVAAPGGGLPAGSLALMGVGV